MKVVKYILKRVIYAGLLIYGYNTLAVQFNLLLPINYFSLGYLSFFGFPGMISLVLFKYLIL